MQVMNGVVAAFLVGCGGGSGDHKAGIITGKVLLAGANEAEHGGIIVYVPGSSFQARTAADGAWQITGLSAGAYEVFAEHPSAPAKRLGNAEIPRNRRQAQIPVELLPVILERSEEAAAAAAPSRDAFGSLRGVVLLENLESSDGVRIRVLGTRFVTAAESDGTFRFPLIDAGDYTIELSRPGYMTTTETVRVEGGRETVIGEVALLQEDDPPAVPPFQMTARAGSVPNTGAVAGQSQLTGSRSIVGLVEFGATEAGERPDFSDVTVAIENTDFLVVPDERGAFRFAQLPPGVYKILAVLGASNTPQVAIADVTLESTARVRFRFEVDGSTNLQQVIQLTGEVTTMEADGARVPVPAASVSLAGIPGATITTGLDGEFFFPNTPATQVSLVVTKEGFEDLTTAVDLTNRIGDVDLGEVVLQRRIDSPRVLSTSPFEGDRDVAVGMALPILIRFSKPMAAESLLPAVRVFPDTDFRLYLGANQHPQSDDSTLVIELLNDDERRPIRFSSVYEIGVSRSATDREGNPLREDFLLTFRTGGFGVVATNPVSGAREVRPGSGQAIEISFNTRLRPESARDGNISIRPRPDTQPQFSFSEDPRTGWTTVRIITRLAENRSYTVSIGRGVRASNGQSLSQAPFEFSFRTGRNPDGITRGGIRPADRNLPR
jgi:hypothetical protein